MEIYAEVQHALGLGLQPKDLSFIQISLRGVLVFLMSLVMMRIAHKRFLAKLSTFDAVLGFMLASMLARAINGTAAFFPTLGAGFVLVGMHALMANLSFRWQWLGFLVKGHPDVLVKDGKADEARMRANRISPADLLEEARLNGNVTDLADIRQATIERNGQVSIVHTNRH